MTARRCAFITYGCRLNQYDTQAIREEILSLGFEESGTSGGGAELGPGGEEEAPSGLDLVVVNSCTVTARAGEKVEARVRALARRNPAAAIIVTGCLTEEDRARIGAIPGVEHLVGNEEKDRIPEIVAGRARPGERRPRRADRHIFSLGVSSFAGHTRAFVKIHDGCDDFCSYCVIPYLRGASRSRAPEDVLAEARRLAAAGHRELVLTGIHLRQYGFDLGLEAGLVDLLPRLREVEGIDRVRLSSIGERAFDERFLALFRADEGLCPSFHIPLQSGSDGVLARMRRGYTAAQYLDTVAMIRTELPAATVATDLMVGFPGETEDEFAESLETCRRAGFLSMHIFPYSPRPRTSAARLPDPVPAETKLERLGRARSLAAELSLTERRRRLGSRVRVLIEQVEGGVASGLSREGLRVAIPAREGSRPGRGEEARATVVGVPAEGVEGRLDVEP